MSVMNAYFLFIDVETTGLDPTGDALLEVAWIVTDEHLETVTSPRSFLIKQGDWVSMFRNLRNAPKTVRDMHRESGLYADITTSDDDAFTWLPAVSAALDEDLGTVPEDATIHLAGMSVHFDRDFLTANHILPSRIHHRHLDVSSIKMLWNSADAPVPVVENLGKHRALNDVYEALHMARAFRDQLVAWAPIEVMR